MEAFTKELRCLQKNQSLPSNSNLLGLAPILGSDGLLRLGGRAGRAKLPYEQLHPPLLPGKHPLTTKIIRAFHQYLKHVGTHFLLTYANTSGKLVAGRR